MRWERSRKSAAASYAVAAPAAFHRWPDPGSRDRNAALFEDRSHSPAAQISPGRHGWPQPPQWAGCAPRSTHLPSQSARPAEQTAGAPRPDPPGPAWPAAPPEPTRSSGSLEPPQVQPHASAAASAAAAAISAGCGRAASIGPDRAYQGGFRRDRRSAGQSRTGLHRGEAGGSRSWRSATVIVLVRGHGQRSWSRAAEEGPGGGAPADRAADAGRRSRRDPRATCGPEGPSASELHERGNSHRDGGAIPCRLALFVQVVPG